MSTLPPYFDLVRQLKNPYSYRLALVDYARQHGIKKAARDFQTTLRTVRKWVRRRPAQGLEGLKELSRAPHSCPHKVRGRWQAEVRSQE